MASAIVIKKHVKLPPRRSKKRKVTYLSSCQVCKSALNSAISAVSSCSHCSYSPHYRIFSQSITFDKLRTSKQIEQWGCKRAITAITLRPAIIEGCGKTDDRQHPYFRKISQLAPARCAYSNEYGMLSSSRWAIVCWLSWISMGNRASWNWSPATAPHRVRQASSSTWCWYGSNCLPMTFLPLKMGRRSRKNWTSRWNSSGMLCVLPSASPWGYQAFDW